MMLSLTSQRAVTTFIRHQHTKCFITTPIFYVNAAPHIGHLYSALIADAAHRFHKLKHPLQSTIFSTGTDEHGLKVLQASHNSNCTDVKLYCDKISSRYKELFDMCEIEYTRFIRTTDPDHVDSVQKFWNLLKSRDYLYLDTYSGWYCVPDEMFLTDSQISTKTDKSGKEIKVSELSGHQVEWNEEENFMFKLSSLKSDLLYWLKDEETVQPNKFHSILKQWIEDSSFDVSVSRPSSRIPWGVPVPLCPSQTVYVWLDALVNYLTVAGFPNSLSWPPTVQVIGKDILKFHGMYWPAFLIAAGLEPPRQLFVHSHWTVNDEKMSKSKNNVVDPFEKINAYTSSGFRYFLLKEGVPHSDGNFTETKVVNMLNADLANTLGNLLNRCSGKVVNAKQVYPSLNKEEFSHLYAENETLKHLTEKLTNIQTEIDSHYESLHFYRGINAVLSVLYDCNRFIEDYKPWELAKNETNAVKLACILHIAFETLRICGIALLPIVPAISNKIFCKLNIPPERTCWSMMKPSWADNSYECKDFQLHSDSIFLYKKIRQ